MLSSTSCWTGYVHVSTDVTLESSRHQEPCPCSKLYHSPDLVHIPNRVDLRYISDLDEPEESAR